MGISGLERKRVEDFPLPVLLSVPWLNVFALGLGSDKGRESAQACQPVWAAAPSSFVLCLKRDLLLFFFKEPIRKRKLYITVKI